MSTDTETISNREKISALREVAHYQPSFLFGLVCLGAFVAFLEGIGLSFIYPIIETAQSQDPTSVSGPVMETFIRAYQFLGIPFSLGYLIVGVALIMIVRYSLSFLVRWLAAILSAQYQKHLRVKTFENALDVKISYYDEAGTDKILNAIITETSKSATVITTGVTFLETLSLVLVYATVTFYVSPLMTVFTIVLLGGITVILRYVIEPAVTVGARQAEANERVQETVQAGVQGIRDVKLFGLRTEVFSEFFDAVTLQANSEITLTRNKQAIRNGFELLAALTIFVLIYIGFVFTELSLGELGIFLIAMFQLAPRVSTLNSKLYDLEGGISHLVRTQEFIDTITQKQEYSGTDTVPDISEISFDDVHFSYSDDTHVLQGISLDVAQNEFVAFVGQSGAGKSTIVSLLARMYDPDRGEIYADRVPIDEYDISEWRERIAVVRQQPFIFTDTLENNVTIANRDATRQEVERVCEIAKVDEFVGDLPNGYESQLGDDGVRLSGGQRQRVALARALLKDADFLVLDEATSDLDSNLEKEVQAAIESMDRDYGIIAIAHRLSTVKNADQIHTVENGQIIESGTHQELLAKDGDYAELYTVQSKA